MSLITEQSALLELNLPQKDPDKKLPVFYNPMMESNRSLSVLLLNSLPKTDLKIALPLAGSGIRAFRFLKELKSDKINFLAVNDLKIDFPLLFEKHLALNKIKSSLIKIYNEDATTFLLKQEGIDYLDLDPFGSPNPFLAGALARISRGGILAVTATDTAALTGTYPAVTKRKYWAVSLKNYLMHETGLRILIRKIQLQGVQFDKALIPLLAYQKNHYYRIYFLSEKGKEKCDQLIKQHQFLLFCAGCLHYETSKFNCGQCSCGKKFQSAGPLWTGSLFDQKLLFKMVKDNPFPAEQKFLEQLKEESKHNSVGFYDLHRIAKIYSLSPSPLNLLLPKIKAVRTHFSPYGFKTDKDIKEIIKIIKELNLKH